MTKEILQTELNNAKTQLDSNKKKLNTLNEKLSAIDMFKKELSTKAQSFQDSISRRKNRLLKLNPLISSVKSAAKYSAKMSDMLKGKEYTKTKNSIDQVQTSVSTERKKIVADIKYVEKEISYWESQVGSLQSDYDNYPEEVENNGN